MMKNKKLAALLGLLLAGSMTVSMAACGSTNSASADRYGAVFHGPEGC